MVVMRALASVGLKALLKVGRSVAVMDASKVGHLAAKKAELWEWWMEVF